MPLCLQACSIAFPALPSPAGSEADAPGARNITHPAEGRYACVWEGERQSFSITEPWWVARRCDALDSRPSRRLRGGGGEHCDALHSRPSSGGEPDVPCPPAEGDVPDFRNITGRGGIWRERARVAAERLASLVCVVAAGAGAEELEAAAEEAVRALQVG